MVAALGCRLSVLDASWGIARFWCSVAILLRQLRGMNGSRKDKRSLEVWESINNICLELAVAGGEMWMHPVSCLRCRRIRSRTDRRRQCLGETNPNVLFAGLHPDSDDSDTVAKVTISNA